MSTGLPQLAQLVDDGARLTGLSLQQWDRVIPHARAAGLMGRLWAAAVDAGVLDELPERVRRHLESAGLLAERQREAACWEVERLHSLLYPRGIPLVLLKGAAYAFTDQPVGRGRTFQDIDILAPPATIGDVERILGSDGWARKRVSEHDRRYYEEWMHEIPPMRQLQRGTNLDIHRAITPPIGRHPVATEKLLAASRPVAGWDDLYVLSEEDQFLHAAAHLFLEEEFEMAYRDILDLRQLYRDASASRPDFAASLARRATEVGLETPLDLAANALAGLFDTEIPLPQRPGLVDALFARVLAPNHPELDNWQRRLAAALLYLRGHAMKLPPRLLLPHLTYKALFAKRAEERDRRRHEEARQQLQQMIGPRR